MKRPMQRDLSILKDVIESHKRNKEWMKQLGATYVEGYDPAPHDKMIEDLEKFIRDHE